MKQNTLTIRCTQRLDWRHACQRRLPREHRRGWYLSINQSEISVNT